MIVTVTEAIGKKHYLPIICPTADDKQAYGKKYV